MGLKNTCTGPSLCTRGEGRRRGLRPVGEAKERKCHQRAVAFGDLEERSLFFLGRKEKTKRVRKERGKEERTTGQERSDKLNERAGKEARGRIGDLNHLSIAYQNGVTERHKSKMEGLPNSREPQKRPETKG